jgi:hypothetical protein
MEQEDMGLELFEAVAGLAEDFGNLTVIVAINELLAIEVSENACCVTCQRKAEWLHRQLSQLLTRYEMEFPEMGAVARINHRMPGLVQ